MPAVNHALSWQSTTLAIVLTALPTVFQPSGKVLGFPSSYNTALRCSPIVCITSLVDTIGRLSVFTGLRFRDDGLKSAGFDEFVRFRYPKSYAAENDRLSFTTLRRWRLLWNLFFVLIALPQAITIFTAQGLKWQIKAACAAYIASYLVDEVILEVATRRQGHTHPLALSEGLLQLRTAGTHPIHEGIVINNGILLSVFLAYEAVWKYGLDPEPLRVRKGFRWSPLSNVIWAVSMYPYTMAGMGPQTSAYDWVFSEEPKVLIFCSFLQHILLPLVMRLERGSRKVREFITVIVAAPVAILCSVGITMLICRLTKGNAGKAVLHVAMGLYFVLLHTAAGILCLS